MKILLTSAFIYSKEQLESISNMGYEVLFIQNEMDIINVDVSEIEVVVCNNLFVYNNIEDFKSLKLIQLTSSGLDRVPINYIIKNKIQLFNAKDVYSIPIAEWAVLKILEIYKNSNYFYHNQSNQYWEKNRELLELTDKKVGIIGYGSIGLELAKRLKAFDAINIAINRSIVESEYIDKYIPLNQLDKVLPELDIIVLTIALTKDTKHLINYYSINKMKEKCVLINVARGNLIKEVDLIKALQQKKFLGVALDVFEEEPLPQKHILWEFNNVIVTPHNSFVSNKNNERLYEVIINTLNNYRLNGGSYGSEE